MTHPRFLFIAAAIVTAFSCGCSDDNRIEFRQIYLVNRYTDSSGFRVPVFDVWSIDTTEKTRVHLYFIVDIDSDVDRVELADSIVKHLCRQIDVKPIELIDMLVVSYIGQSGYTDKLDTNLWQPTNFGHPEWADPDDFIIEYIVRNGKREGTRRGPRSGFEYDSEDRPIPTYSDSLWKPPCIVDYVYRNEQ